jgi:hypothetical protein
MDIKYIYHIHPHSPFPCAHHLPLVSTPGKDICFPLLFTFLKCILIVQGGFAVILQACIYHALIKLAPPLLTLSLSPCSPNVQQLTVQYIMLYSYIDGLFQYFNSVTFSLPLLPPVGPSYSLIQFCSLSLYMYIYTYM